MKDELLELLAAACVMIASKQGERPSNIPSDADLENAIGLQVAADTSLPLTCPLILYPYSKLSCMRHSIQLNMTRVSLWAAIAAHIQMYIGVYIMASTASCRSCVLFTRVLDWHAIMPLSCRLAWYSRWSGTCGMCWLMTPQQSAHCAASSSTSSAWAATSWTKSLCRCWRVRILVVMAFCTLALDADACQAEKLHG